MNRKTIYTAFAIGIATCIQADHVQFSELPKAVQQTINRNLNGGTVQEIDHEARDGRTVYDVEVRREGQNRHLRVDSDGRLLDAKTGVEVKVDGKDIFDKNDGKILGVVDKPRDNDAGAQAEVKIETDIDKSKIKDRDLNARVDVDTDVDDGKVEVKARAGEKKRVFSKSDGKLLGFIPWNKRNKAEADIQVDTDRNTVTKKADGSLDTDKGDGRILGVPKRGFETLSLRDVPAAVRTTINRAAPGTTVAEIELATHNNERVYEVDIQRDGKNRELHIAPDGTLLKDSDRESIGRPGSTDRGTGRSIE